MQIGVHHQVEERGHAVRQHLGEDARGIRAGADGVDAVEQGLDCRDASRLEARLVHTRCVEGADAALARRSARPFLHRLGHDGFLALDVRLHQLLVASPLRALRRNGMRALPAAACERVEVLAGILGGVDGPDVEAEIGYVDAR